MYKRILIINLMYIGDLLFTTPLLRTLRTNFKEADIVMLADEKNCNVLQQNPHISELIAIDKKGYHNKFKNYIRLITDIRQRNFDLVINLHRNERASTIAAFSGAKKIIGFSAKGLGIFFDKVIPERTDIHQVDAYLETLQAAGIEQTDNQGLEIWINKQTQKKADKTWQEAFSQSPYGLCGMEQDGGSLPFPVIGINTGGSWPTKRWTKAGFASLADKLLVNGYGIAFFGGPMDKDDVEQICALMKEHANPRLGIFTGKTTLLEMAALVKKCSLLVSGDSGPMHIAVAQKVPVVAIFGPSDSVRYAPYKQPNAVIVANKNCLACGRHQCDEHGCMKDITAELISDKVLNNIKGKHVSVQF